MSFDLCQVKQASKPYYIETIGTFIYSIEELCFYLYENMVLVDQSIMNEQLCIWLRDELGLKRLARQLSEQLEREEGIAGFILPIFREIGYLSAAGMREYAEKIGKLDVQAGDLRQKLKADYLVRSGMYENAINEYWQILDRQSPSSLGTAFYAGVWNNLGCAQARMFRFEEAADCFYRAWKLTPTGEMLRKYVGALPLYLDEEDYEKKLSSLGVDRSMIAKIQEHNLRLGEEAGKRPAKENGKTPKEQLEQLKKEYRRSVRKG